MGAEYDHGLPSPTENATAHIDVNNGQGTAETPPSDDPVSEGSERVTNYRKPEGTELAPEAVAEIAAGYARVAGDTEEVAVEVAHGSFAETSALLGVEPVPNNAHPEGQEWLESSAYIAQVQGTFPNAITHAPPGQTAPGGSNMVLIVDAHTGFVETRGLGAQRAPLEHLAQAQAHLFLVNRAGAVAEIARGGAPPPGAQPHYTVTGRLYVNGKHAGEWWDIWLGRAGKVTEHPVEAGGTNAHGIFTLRLPPKTPAGTYVIGAAPAAHNHRLCGTARVRLVHTGTVHVTIRCHT